MSDKRAFLLIGDTREPVFGLSGRERLRRALAKGGITQSVDEATAQNWQGPLLVIRADFVLDQGLVKAIASAPDTALAHDLQNGPIVAVHSSKPANHAAALSMVQGQRSSASSPFLVLDADRLAGSYNHALRKRSRPLLIATTTSSVTETERQLFENAYKGVTDFVTKHVWPRPALFLTRICAQRGITPNQVTLISAVFVLLAMWLFWRSDFLLGIACAWAMCFLDTVDGKLARVTLTSTSWGNVFDHGIDLLHPPFWYYAWFVGLGSPDDMIWVLWVVILGYIIGRLQEGLFIWLFKIEIHTWRPIDSWFRQITARRNPNLFILMIASILGAPALGFVLVAYWTMFSLGFHFVRIFQAGWSVLRGRKPQSWLLEPIEPMAEPRAT